MPAPSWIPIIVGLAVAAMIGIALVASLVRGQPIDVSTLALIAAGWGGGVSITAFVLRIVDRRLWRSVLFRRLPLPNAPPVLHGTWTIKITTFRADGSTASARAPTRPYAYLVVEQKFSSISVRALFDMGYTQATQAILTKRDGYWELLFFYDFVPQTDEVENPHRRRPLSERGPHDYSTVRRVAFAIANAERKSAVQLPRGRRPRIGA